jgi:propanol-preferring alcohol dehydrogenase
MKSFQVADFNAPLKEVDQPTPQPSGTQVLIKVKAAGVCHSDLHIWEGGYDLGHGRKPLSLKDRGVSLPRTMGHETVGEVLAFGPDAKAATRAISRSATSRWSIPGSAAANARPVSAATRTCA